MANMVITARYSLRVAQSVRREGLRNGDEKLAPRAEVTNNNE